MQIDFKRFAIGFLIISLLLNVGCRGKEEITGGSEGDDGGSAEDNIKKDQPPDASAFWVKVEEDKRYAYKIHRGDGSSSDNWAAPCEITPGSTDTDIQCIVEGHEIEFWHFGVGIRTNFPPGMCRFAYRLLAYSYKYDAGTGATNVIDNRAGSNTNGGVAAGATSAGFFCPYDHSTNGDGPNCCVGSYTLTTYTDDPASATDKVTVADKKWGGKWSNCLVGPEITVGSFKDKTSGYPTPERTDINGVGLNVGFFLAPPAKTLDKGSLMYIANYFNPAAHVATGGIPRSITATGAPRANEYHTFMCEDAAGEKLARIRLMIREWNTVAELSKGVSGDPDSGGNEPIFGGPNNDVADFDDFGNSYPGSGY